MKAARHHRRNKFSRHALHCLVTRGYAGEISLAGRAHAFGCHQRGRDDGGIRVRQHAESVVLAARQRQLGIRIGGTALGHQRAIHHQCGAFFHAGFFVSNHLQRLLARAGFCADQRGSHALQRNAFGAIHHGGRKVLIAQTGDPFCEGSAD